MELETMHDRGFYLAMAEKHPSFLEEIIAGEKGFAETLGELILAAEGDENDALENLQGYLAVLAEFSMFEDEGIVSTGSQAAEDYGSWVKGNANYEKANKKADAIGYPSILTVLGGSAMFIILANPLGAALAVAGYLGILKAASVESEPKGKRKNALSLIQETVTPFCEQLDLHVMTFFAANYFNNARDHFEQTYPLLERGQRKTVDAQLHSYLGAGGIRGMDEVQLKDYLTGLLDTLE